MTTAQKLKEARDKLSGWQGKKSFLAKNERQLYKNKIVELENKVKDNNQMFQELESKKLQNVDLKYKASILTNKNRELQRKIEHLHEFYQNQIKEIKDAN